MSFTYVISILLLPITYNICHKTITLLYFYSVLKDIVLQFFTVSLKKDVKAWVKANTGEYCLGKIVFVNDFMVKIEFNDGKIERCLRSESLKLVPDIVPCRNELTVGTRVLSQWLHRHTFYPGVVSAIRRGDSYDILFDDGDMGRGKLCNMRLMKNFPDRKFCINKYS